MHDVAKESQNQSVFTKKRFDKEHEAELSDFDYYDSRLSELLKGSKATPKAWAKEIGELKEAIPPLQEEYRKEVSGLATAEVIEYTKKDMERIEANEWWAAEHQRTARNKSQQIE